MAIGRIGAALAAMLLLAAGSARAQAADPVPNEGGLGLYGVFRLVPSLSNVDDLTSRPVGGVQLKDDEIEFVAAGGVGLGYEFNRQGLPVRLEVEYLYRYHFDLESNRGGRGGIDYDASTKQTHSVFLDLAYVIETKTRLRPFLNAGIGWARAITETDRVDLTSRAVESRETTRDNVAWRVGAGTYIRLTKDLNAELAYRYTDLGSVDIGRFSSGDSVEADHWFAHDFTLGLLYSF